MVHILFYEPRSVETVAQKKKKKNLKIEPRQNGQFKI